MNSKGGILLGWLQVMSPRMLILKGFRLLKWPQNTLIFVYPVLIVMGKDLIFGKIFVRFMAFDKRLSVNDSSFVIMDNTRLEEMPFHRGIGPQAVKNGKTPRRELTGIDYTGGIICAGRSIVYGSKSICRLLE